MKAPMQRILIIEDHETTRRTIALYLQRAGYEVCAQADGLAGLNLAMNRHFDLLVVDLMLPGIDGREICKRLRALPQTQHLQLIMLTALSTEDDIVAGLGLGADDYLTKPFSPRELVARVQARLRVADARALHLVTVGQLTLDKRARLLLKDGQPLALTETEYRLIEVMMNALGRAFSRDELIERALGHDFEGGPKNIDIHISNLRKRIETDRSKPEYILTVSGYGYRFNAGGKHD